MGSSKGREVDAPSVTAATVENEPGEASAFDTNQPRVRPDVADALVSAAFEGTYSNIILESASLMINDAPAVMTGGPAAEKKGGVKRARAKANSRNR